jgi:hypothetical protein
MKQLPQLQKLQKHCHKHLRNHREFKLEVDHHGHVTFLVKTETFAKFKDVILDLAEFLTRDDVPPATKLNLAFGTPERR